MIERTPEDSRSMTIKIVRAICVASVLIVGLIVGCEIKDPLKSDGQRCADLCGASGVKQFFGASQFVCECNPPKVGQ